jgi:hypothetical protein
MALKLVSYNHNIVLEDPASCGAELKANSISVSGYFSRIGSLVGHSADFFHYLFSF